MACPDRDHFSGNTVGAYCIRPTEWPRRGQERVSVIDHLDHSPHKWDVCGAYAIRPYTGTCKRATFSTSHPIASPKGSLFFVSHRKTYPDRNHFSTVRVGAYGIRPTERHPMDGECLSTTNGRTLALLRRDVWRAYSFAPYTGTCKRAAVRVYTRLEPSFLGMDSIYLYDSSPKRGI